MKSRKTPRRPSLDLPWPGATIAERKDCPVWKAELDPTIAAGYEQSERNERIGTYVWYAFMGSCIAAGLVLVLLCIERPIYIMALAGLSVLSGAGFIPVIGLIRRRAFDRADCAKYAVQAVDGLKKKLAEISRHTGREYTMDTPAQEVIDDIRSVAEAYAALHLLFGAMGNGKLTAKYLAALSDLLRACPREDWMDEWGTLFGRARQILSAATKVNT